MTIQTQKWVLGSAIAIVCLVLSYILFWALFVHVWEAWQEDPFYQHGFWILGISMGLYGAFIFRRRKTPILVLERKQQKVAFVLFMVAAVCFGMGIYTYLGFLGGLAFTFWMIAIHCLFFDVIYWKEFSFPFVYFLSGVPLPYLGTFSAMIQVWIATYVTKLFVLMGVPAHAVGIHVYLPNASFQIAPNCTGLTSWLVLLALVLLAVRFMKFPLIAKILSVLFVLPVAFFSNGLRVISLLWVGYRFGEVQAMHFWHTYGGFLFYGISCGILIFMLLGFQKYAGSSE